MKEVRRLSKRGTRPYVILTIIATALALPIIAIEKVASAIFGLGYVPYVVYAVALTVLSAKVLKNKDDITFNRSVGGKPILYLAILISMVVILGIY